MNKPIVSGSRLHLRNYTAASFLCAALILLCAVLNLWNAGSVWAIVIVFLLLGYIVVGARDPNRDFDLLTKYSETTYFMGYFGTIAVLAGLAWQVTQNPETINKLGELLGRGGSAIFSTVVGLFGMFVLRIAAQSHEKSESDEGAENGSVGSEADEVLQGLKDKSQAIVVALGQLSTEHAQALGEVFGKLVGLGASVEGLSAVVDRITGSLNALQGSSSSANEALAGVAAHATTIHGAATKLDQVFNSLVPAWEQIKDHVQAAAGLNQQIVELVQTLDSLKTWFGTCQAEVKGFTETCATSHTALLNTLDKVEKRATEIGNLSNSVRQFVDAANTIAPSLNTINENLRGIGPINEAVRQLGGNIQNLNAALTKSAEATESITQNSYKLMNSTATFADDMQTQFKKLVDSAKSLAEFSTVMDKIRPGLEAICKNIENLNQFTNGVSGVQSALKELEANAKLASSEMKNFDIVIDSFVRAVETFVAHSGANTAFSGRHPQ